MPTLRYPVLRVCAVRGPAGSLRLRLARPGTTAGARGAMLRRRGDRRTLVNGWALEWGDPQPMCRAHQTRSTWGLGLSGNTSPAGPASAVLVSAEHGRLNRRDWGHQLGRLHVSENLLFLESRTPLRRTALLTGCGTSMRRRAPHGPPFPIGRSPPTTAATPLRARSLPQRISIVTARQQTERCPQGRHTKSDNTCSRLPMAHTDRACRAPLVVCGASGRVWGYISCVLAFPV